MSHHTAPPPRPLVNDLGRIVLCTDPLPLEGGYDRPPAIRPHARLLILRDPYGRRWRIDDVDARERPLRWIPPAHPPDPQLTHRVFRSHDGVRCWLHLHGIVLRIREGVYATQSRDWLQNAEGQWSALSAAVRATTGARARLAALGTPWRQGRGTAVY